MAAIAPGYVLHQADEALIDSLQVLDRTAFALPMDDAAAAAMPFPVPVERTVAVLGPDGTPAAMHGSYPFTMSVPGGRLACAGLTFVGVHPAHRRRGLARAMVTSHLQRTRERGEPLSALFAAEAGIYGRFGFGSAADDVRLAVPRRAALRSVAGTADLTVRFGAPRGEDLARLDRVHRRAGQHRPGWVTRDTPVLSGLRIIDPPAQRGGGEPLQLVQVQDAAGELRAFALLRRHEVWEPAGPQFTVEVREAVALDAPSAHRLWSFLLDLDLTSRIDSPMLALDDPLLQLLVDRRAAAPRLSDNLWLRVVDVPAALAGRSYAAPIDLVLRVGDPLLPDNTGGWRLTARPGEAAQVSRSDAAGDLELDVRELGAAYLGGRSVSAMVAAGLVDERTPGSAAVVTAALSASLAPFCSWVF